MADESRLTKKVAGVLVGHHGGHQPRFLWFLCRGRFTTGTGYSRDKVAFSSYPCPGVPDLTWALFPRPLHSTFFTRSSPQWKPFLP